VAQRKVALSIVFFHCGTLEIGSIRPDTERCRREGLLIKLFKGKLYYDVHKAPKPASPVGAEEEYGEKYSPVV